MAHSRLCSNVCILYAYATIVIAIRLTWRRNGKSDRPADVPHRPAQEENFRGDVRDPGCHPLPGRQEAHPAMDHRERRGPRIARLVARLEQRALSPTATSPLALFPSCGQAAPLGIVLASYDTRSQADRPRAQAAG